MTTEGHEFLHFMLKQLLHFMYTHIQVVLYPEDEVFVVDANTNGWLRLHVGSINVSCRMFVFVVSFTIFCDCL